MKLLSVNIGQPQEHVWQGRPVRTGIFKYPTEQPVTIHSMGIEGDGQADLVHHGGVDKAIYAYASEHYAFWRDEWPAYDFQPANFGENLTTEGLLDADVRIGDEFRIGTSILRAVQPRFPCAKLGLRFNDPSMIMQFKRARRHGIYFRVVEPGQIRANDVFEQTNISPYDISVQDVVEAFYEPDTYPDTVETILSISAFPSLLRQHFAKFA